MDPDAMSSGHSALERDAEDSLGVQAVNPDQWNVDTAIG